MSKTKKSEYKEPEFDLSTPVIDADGNPELQAGEFKFAQLDKPMGIEFVAGGKKRTELIAGVAINSKGLTIRGLISRALRGGGQQQQGAASPVDTDRRGSILLKCVADKVDLDKEDQADIIKCVRDLGDALYYMRIKQFFGDW